VVEQAVEHSGDGGAVAEQFSTGSRQVLSGSHLSDRNMQEFAGTSF
jgi:hypothetical protein